MFLIVLRFYCDWICISISFNILIYFLMFLLMMFDVLSDEIMRINSYFFLKSKKWSKYTKTKLPLV